VQLTLHEVRGSVCGREPERGERLAMPFSTFGQRSRACGAVEGDDG